jgi:hypothetical protein
MKQYPKGQPRSKKQQRIVSRSEEKLQRQQERRQSRFLGIMRRSRPNY